jgi:hypothetical protein
LKTQDVIKQSNNKCSGGWWLGAAIPEILRGFNDDNDEKYQGEGKLRGISVLVTDTPHLPQPPQNEEPTYKGKRVGKEILRRAWVHICSTDYSPEPHITCDSGSGG